MADEHGIQIAILQTQVANLTAQVADLATSVKELTAVMNRGKGAFAASLALAGAVGAAVMKGTSYLLTLGHHGGNP